MMGENSNNITKPPEEIKERIKRTEKKTRSSTSNELEKASLGEGSNGVVGKTNNEKSKLTVGLWETTQNYEVKFCHYENKRLD